METYGSARGTLYPTLSASFNVGIITLTPVGELLFTLPSQTPDTSATAARPTVF